MATPAPKDSTTTIDEDDQIKDGEQMPPEEDKLACHEDARENKFPSSDPPASSSILRRAFSLISRTRRKLGRRRKKCGGLDRHQVSIGSNSLLNFRGVRGATLRAISFSGAGFMGSYHAGVADCLLKHAPKLLASPSTILVGVSAGSLLVCALVGDVSPLKSQSFFKKFATHARSHALGVLSPKYSLLEDMKQDIHELFPEDIHLRANGKVILGVTDVEKRSCHFIKHFSSKQDVIDACFASSYIPLLTSKKPIVYHGHLAADGGLKNNWPELTHGVMKDIAGDAELKPSILVSPFAGNFDISPQVADIEEHEEDSWFHLDIHIPFQDHKLDLSRKNVKRLWNTMFPPSGHGLDDVFQDGYDDAARFLQTHRDEDEMFR